MYVSFLVGCLARVYQLISQVQVGVTHYDDLHRDGEGQLVAVTCPQLLHHYEKHTADQGKDQRGNIGLGKSTDDVHQSLGCKQIIVEKYGSCTQSLSNTSVYSDDPSPIPVYTEV